MAAGKLNYLIEQGAEWERVVTVLDNSSPRVLTDYTIEMELRATAGAPVIIALTTANARIVITDAAAGEFTMTLTPEATAELEFTTAMYDVKLTPPGGAASRLMEGTIRLSKQVTI